MEFLSDVASSGNAAEKTDDDLDEGTQGAFGQLILPPGHKKMVLSLISQHFRNRVSQERNDEQVDIVRGKGKIKFCLSRDVTSDLANTIIGKGLIILLHGAPGVGKTTTAGTF